MSTAGNQQSWRSGTRQPGGQDAPIAKDVRDEDAAKPKPQRYTVFVDEPLEAAASAT